MKIQTFSVHLTVPGRDVPTFFVKGYTRKAARDKAINLVDCLGGWSVVESGYMTDSSGAQESLC